MFPDGSCCGIMLFLADVYKQSEEDDANKNKECNGQRIHSTPRKL